MDVRDLERLFCDRMLDGLKTIHVTGGSPFLSQKILSLVDILSEYHGDCPINSPISGLYPHLMEKICKVIVKKLPQWRFNVALEGPTPRIHELIRGKDSWHPTRDTLAMLDDLGCNYRLNMTLYPENYKYIREMKNMAVFNNVQLYINFGRFSRRFGNDKDAIGPVNPHVIKFVEWALNDIGWLKERKLNEQKWILQKAFWQGKKVRFQCKGGSEFIDVDPWGNVWSCLMYPPDFRFGNLYFGTLSHIMDYWLTRKSRRLIWDGTCSITCPFTCSLRIANVTLTARRYGING